MTMSNIFLLFYFLSLKKNTFENRNFRTLEFTNLKLYEVMQRLSMKK